MDKLKVGLDIDGVLRNFASSLVDTYKTRYPEHDVTPIYQWSNYDISGYFPIGKDIQQFMRDHCLEIFLLGKPYQNAQRAFKHLKETNKVVIVSYQISKLAEEVTSSWLRLYGLIPDEIIFTDKKEEVKGIDLLVDDCTDNLRKIRAKENGVVPVAFTRPWNKDWNGKRVKDWDDLFGFIDYLKNDGRGVYYGKRQEFR